MNKNQLSELLSHYSGSSDQEAKEVYALSKRFPYSQLLQTLAARTAKDHKWENQQAVLQLAAVYSTDRSVLKEIMLTPYQSRGAETLAEAPSAAKEKAPHSISEIDRIDYAEEIMIDLKKLKELKLKFESLFTDQEGAVIEKPKPKPKSPPKISKRERLIQLAKELDEKIQHEKSDEQNPDVDPLISEIKATRKKVKPENEKTKEQIEIINQYIKSKPSIASPKPVSEPNEDLASALKSGEFGDNIVSETLAEILVRQGKKDKAIEVYKKLIWKFPQKKAYFAAQIEDLKK